MDSLFGMFGLGTGDGVSMEDVYVCGSMKVCTKWK